MGGYLLKRLLMLPPVLLGVTVIVFLVMALIPGDPAMAILGTYATPENLAQVRLELGLNHPLPIRYLFWLNAVLHGNLGWSYILHKPVLDEVMARLGPTMLLAGASLVLCAIIGIPLGIIAAVRQNAWEDKLITVTVLVGVSTPSFWLGMLLILWFAVRLQWLPDGGMYDLFGDGGIIDLLTHLALPAITLAAVPAAVLVRLTRTAMLEVMRQDYVRTARAKGVRESRVILRHVFGNALVGVIPDPRHRGRLRARRRGLCRDRVSMARHRPDAGQRHLDARHPARPRRRAGGRHCLYRHQPAHRYRAGAARSPDPDLMSGAHGGGLARDASTAAPARSGNSGATASRSSARR